MWPAEYALNRLFRSNSALHMLIEAAQGIEAAQEEAAPAMEAEGGPSGQENIAMEAEGGPSGQENVAMEADVLRPPPSHTQSEYLQEQIKRYKNKARPPPPYAPSKPLTQEQIEWYRGKAKAIASILRGRGKNLTNPNENFIAAALALIYGYFRKKSGKPNPTAAAAAFGHPTSNPQAVIDWRDKIFLLLQEYARESQRILSRQSRTTD
jgi:hypothetical protein